MNETQSILPNNSESIEDQSGQNGTTPATDNRPNRRNFLIGAGKTAAAAALIATGANVAINAIAPETASAHLGEGASDQESKGIENPENKEKYDRVYNENEPVFESLIQERSDKIDITNGHISNNNNKYNRTIKMDSDTGEPYKEIPPNRYGEFATVIDYSEALGDKPSFELGAFAVGDVDGQNNRGPELLQFSTNNIPENLGDIDVYVSDYGRGGKIEYRTEDPNFATVEVEGKRFIQVRVPRTGGSEAYRLEFINSKIATFDDENKLTNPEKALFTFTCTGQVNAFAGIGKNGLNAFEFMPCGPRNAGQARAEDLTDALN